MSTFIKSDQSAPNLLRDSPISRSGFVHPDQRVITGLTCTKKALAFVTQHIMFKYQLHSINRTKFKACLKKAMFYTGVSFIFQRAYCQFSLLLSVSLIRVHHQKYK